MEKLIVNFLNTRRYLRSKCRKNAETENRIFFLLFLHYHTFALFFFFCFFSSHFGYPICLLFLCSSVLLPYPIYLF